MPTKILVLSAKAGSGHIMAARGIEDGFKIADPNVEVVNKSCLEYLNPLWACLYPMCYDLLVNNGPSVWGRLYRAFDKNNSKTGLIGRVGLAAQSLVTRGMLELIEGEKADAVVCAHFLLPQVIGNLPHSYPLYVVVTDYVLHYCWVNPNVTHYFTGSQFARSRLVERGIKDKKVTVTGLPLRNAFINPPTRGEARNRLAIADNALVVLMMSNGRMLETAQMVQRARRPVTLISVAGNNEKEKRRLANYSWKSHVKHHGLGFTDDMATLMSAADMVITKSGGLSVAETISLGLPMVITPSVPGQESGNARWLKDKGAALVADNPRELSQHVIKMITDDKLRAKTAAASKAIGTRRASEQIASHVLQDING